MRDRARALPRGSVHAQLVEMPDPFGDQTPARGRQDGSGVLGDGARASGSTDRQSTLLVHANEDSRLASMSSGWMCARGKDRACTVADVRPEASAVPEFRIIAKQSPKPPTKRHRHPRLRDGQRDARSV